MATSPTQTQEDLAPPSPRLPTRADVERRMAELRGRSPQPKRNPPPVPEPPQPPRAAAPNHPHLDRAAFHGPAGRFVNCLAPHTEAHPAALLLQFLAAFGNLLGPGPHCQVESTRHALNLFVILVGDSSKARKGTSWNLVANLFTEVDPTWLATRVNSARLTANGLVQTLRDQQPPTDRRLLALSEEFATVIHSLKRGDGHLSPLLRCAWDHGHLPALELQQPLRATGTHLSLIAHITQEELLQTFKHPQAHNGFANRCLWTWVERGNCLPDGGSAPPQELSAIAATLRRAVAWANARPEILLRRDQQAGELWADRYAALSYRHAGLRGAATSRGEAQVLRLSALYAALDASEIVCLPHLEAAYAVWTYCYQSAIHLFGVSTGNPIADRIRDAIDASTRGLTRNQINRLFYGHVDSDRIDAALDQLASYGQLIGRREPTSGRRSTLWMARQQPSTPQAG